MCQPVEILASRFLHRSISPYLFKAVVISQGRRVWQAYHPGPC
jgi:hypothetical protein